MVLTLPLTVPVIVAMRFLCRNATFEFWLPNYKYQDIQIGSSQALAEPMYF